MSSRLFTSPLVLICLSCLGAPPRQAASAQPQPAVEATRPNILVFYVDDMGWGSIGPNGQADRRAMGLPYVHTPNLDRLAAEGVNFTRGYGCHVCSPARSSLQTGFHQGHTFADRNDPDNAKKAIRTDDTSIGDVLYAAGYHTGYWGKWGYGGSKDHDSPVIENVQTLPTSHGYQHVLAELHHVRAHTFFQPTLWHAPSRTDTKGGLELIANSMSRYEGESGYPATPAHQNHQLYPSVAYCDDSYAFAALDFVREHGQIYHQTGTPFHGLLAVQIPHAPFEEVSTLPDWDAAYRDDPQFSKLKEQTQQWAAMVTRIDAHFGNLLAALEDPNHDGDTSDSIVNDTLVIFTSDNGGPAGQNNQELNANGGLTGTKGKIQEGGIRVPLVMRWPAKIHESSELRVGSDCDLVVDVTDLLPTFCELAGVPVPLGVDGVSIAPFLTGKGIQRRRDFIIHEAGNGQSIIRGRHKLVRSTKGALSLYDLEADPTESIDIASNYPAMVRELESELLAERVLEPRGFANTYHKWTGDDRAPTSSPDNWSDYEYSNEGITYLRDVGEPKKSWVAHIENRSSKPRIARVDTDLELLALSVEGGDVPDAVQDLVVPANVSLVGRNEIRVNLRALLSVDGGSVSSARWLDVAPGGLVRGHGMIRATVFNQGTVAAICNADQNLHIDGDYHQGSSGAIKFVLSNHKSPTVHITGAAHLDGSVQVEFAKGFQPSKGQSIRLLSADVITGSFDQRDTETLTIDGRSFKIVYDDSGLSLITLGN